MVARKRGRPAKDEGEGLTPITVLVPAEIKNDLERQAKTEGRPLSEVARRRLGQQDERNEFGLSAHAHALGRLVAFLSNELLEYGPPGQQTEYIRYGLNRIVAQLNPPTKGLAGPAHDAETFADYWWLRLRNAGEQTYEAGKPVPTSQEQRALAEIWKQLAPQQSRKRKEP